MKIDKATHELLVRADIKGAWEHPPGADWRSAMAEIECAKVALENILRCDLHLDKDVQDASFLADLGVLVQQTTETGSTYFSYDICYRFSWFSKLFTIYGNRWEEYEIEKARGLLHDHGFSYVSEEDLQAPYDGLNQPYEKGLTWWARFFDYL